MISNNTKLDVPMNIQRKKRLGISFKLRVPNSNPKTYYDLTSHIFKMRFIDADGNEKFLFNDNRFGKDTEFQRSLMISEGETESLDPNEVYYYDLRVVFPEGYGDYLTGGRVIVEDYITP